MNSLKIILGVTLCSLLSGCLGNTAGLNILYAKESRALYVFNKSSSTNISKIKMELHNDTLVFTNISHKLILINKGNTRSIVYNNLKIIIGPEVKYVKHKDFVCPISELGRADEAAISKSHSFLLQIKPREFPYDLR